MTETSTVPSSAARPSGRSTLATGLVGGAVAVVLAFLPFSTLLGGGVAGYLRGGSAMDGARAGAVAGLLAFLPLALVLLAVSAFVPIAMMGSMGPRAGIGGLVGVFFLGFVSLLGLAYTVGFGAAGGAIGAYVKEESSTRS